MKILLDLGHPAHIHYFKNAIWQLQDKGHEFLIVARDKEVLHKLLKLLNFKYETRGKGKNSLLGKFSYILQADYRIFKISKSFKPDLFLSFASPYAAHISKLLGKPHITFDDTENAHLAHKLYAPFTDVIISPSCFTEPFSHKQIFFDGFMELCYLHPDYFTPDKTIYNDLNVSENEKYVIIRFVSWQANHDFGHKGISDRNKIKAVNEFSKFAKVFITSEGPLPEEIEKYRIKISPEKIHHALAFASLLYGESATMASECAVLGTPAIYIDNIGRGYTTEEELRYNLVFNFSESVLDQENSILKGVELLQEANTKSVFQQQKDKLLNDKIDVTAFMIWFLENYPTSANIMKENPEYQRRFNK